MPTPRNPHERMEFWEMKDNGTLYMNDDELRHEVARLRNENEALRASTLSQTQAQPPQELDANGLLPCPFCGADTMVLEGPGGAMVVCGGNRCAVMPSSKDKDLAAAITAWNRRAQPPTPQPVPDTVRQAIMTLCNVNPYHSAAQFLYDWLTQKEKQDAPHL